MEWLTWIFYALGGVVLVLYLYIRWGGGMSRATIGKLVGVMRVEAAGRGKMRVAVRQHVRGEQGFRDVYVVVGEVISPWNIARFSQVEAPRLAELLERAAAEAPR